MKYIYILSFVVLQACSGQVSNSNVLENNDMHIIDIDNIEPASNIKLSSYFSSLEFIPLETNNEALLGRINKLHVYNDTLFILDKTGSKGVFMFNRRDGSFLGRIGSIGSGPGEYSSLEDFTIDIENRRLYLLDSDRQQIYEYELGGCKYLTTVSLNAKANRSYNIQYWDNKVYGDLFFRRKSTKNDYMLCELDMKTGEVNNFWLSAQQYNLGWSELFFINKAFYSQPSLKPKFVQLFMNVIMEIDNNGVSPFLHFQNVGADEPVPVHFQLQFRIHDREGKQLRPLRGREHHVLALRAGDGGVPGEALVLEDQLLRAPVDAHLAADIADGAALVVQLVLALVAQIPVRLNRLLERLHDRLAGNGVRQQHAVDMHVVVVLLPEIRRHLPELDETGEGNDEAVLPGIDAEHGALLDLPLRRDRVAVLRDAVVGGAEGGDVVHAIRPEAFHEAAGDFAFLVAGADCFAGFLDGEGGLAAEIAVALHFPVRERPAEFVQPARDVGGAGEAEVAAQFAALHDRRHRLALARVVVPGVETLLVALFGNQFLVPQARHLDGVGDDVVLLPGDEDGADADFRRDADVVDAAAGEPGEVGYALDQDAVEIELVQQLPDLRFLRFDFFFDEHASPFRKFSRAFPSSAPRRRRRSPAAAASPPSRG